MPLTNKQYHQELHLPIEPLLMLLRKRGFVIKPDDYVEVLRLVEHFGSANLDETAKWLCPALATNEYEQVQFFQVLEEYKKLHQAATVVVPKPPVSWWRKYWWIHILIIGLIIWLVMQPVENESFPLVAKISTSSLLYEVGDTIVLDAGDVFQNNVADTAEVMVNWLINGKVKLSGIHQSYVADTAGSLQIIQQLQSTSIPIARSEDTAQLRVCSFLPLIQLEASMARAPLNTTITVKAVPLNDGTGITQYLWEWHKGTERTASYRPFVNLLFDSVGTFSVTCTALSGNASSPCIGKSVIYLEVFAPLEDYALEVASSGNDLKAPKPHLKSLWNWLLLVPAIIGSMFFAWYEKNKPKAPPPQDTGSTPEPDDGSKMGSTVIVDGSGNTDVSNLKPIFDIPFEQRDTRLVADEAALRRIFNQMRQRTEEEQLQLQVVPSIRAIIQSGGMPELVFAPKRSYQQYLIAIDRTNPNSLFTAFFEWVARSMKECNIPQTTCYYDAQLQFYLTDYPLGIDLQRLNELYGRCTLIIMGNAHPFVYRPYPIIDPQVGDILQNWQQKAVITPIPFADWDARENALATQFVVVPADIKGLEYLLPSLREKAITKATLWNHADGINDSLQEWDFRDIDDLKNYLDNDEILIQWLCAIAVYPRMRWEVLVEIGKVICDKYQAPEKLCYTNLLKLCRIPWLGSGTFPQRTRLQLLKLLKPENEVIARATLLNMLNYANLYYGSGYYFNYEQQEQQMTHEFVLYAADQNKYPHFEQSSEDFVKKWRLGEVVDAPLVKYFGTQQNEKWTTPFASEQTYGNGIEVWLDKVQQDALKMAKRKWSKMEYLQSLLGWLIIGWVLLFFKIVPVQSAMFKKFYDTDQYKNISLQVQLALEDSCLPFANPLVYFVSGNDSFPMMIDDETYASEKNIRTGSLTANYAAIQSPGTAFVVLWGNNKKAMGITGHIKDTLIIKMNCQQYLAKDTTPFILDTLVKTNLPGYLDEIWSSRTQRMAIDLATNTQYIESKNNQGIIRRTIKNVYVEAPDGFRIITEDEFGINQRDKIMKPNPGGFTQLSCLTGFDGQAAETADCQEISDAFALYYPNERNKIFLPRNLRNFANSERKKMTISEEKAIAILKQREDEAAQMNMKQRSNQMMQQVVPEPSQVQLELNVYINKFYAISTSLQQARYNQIKAQWPERKKRIALTWKLNTYNGGAFDRDYIQVNHQYVPDEKQLPESVPGKESY